MKTQVFRHGLNEPFIDTLNREYEKSGWWKRIVDDEHLFIGIRNHCLNVYFNGGSILELKHTSVLNEKICRLQDCHYSTESACYNHQNFRIGTLEGG